MPKTPPESKVGAQRAQLFKATSFNPIRGLTPNKLSGYLDAFDRGFLREAALVWQKIMERDDQVKTCHPKRSRNVTALDWEILSIDDSPEAKKHKEALEAFYNNLTACNGLNENERGGLRLLIKLMMTAVGMRYACFEIVWAPDAPGGLTAEFKFLPLQFFENTTGRLRFLKSDFDPYGVPLDDFFGEYGWMIASGEGLMEASSVAYMFKNLPLKAWLTYCEKFGIPGLHGKTSAAKDSPEWDALVSAIGAFGEDLGIVTNDGASITPIELKAGASQPHPPLVERMDRAISRLWLGGDLATMSASGSAVGSNPQSDDLQKLQEDDAAMITDSLQHYVDRAVISMLFGVEKPMAYFKLKPPAKINVDREIKIDQFLIGAGAPIGRKDLLERYGRAEPDSGDQLATVPATVSSPFSASNEIRRRASNVAAADVTFRAQSLKELSEAQAKSLRPLVDRLNAILTLPDDKVDAALQQLQSDLPRINREVLKDAQTQLAFEKILGAAVASGMAEGRRDVGQNILPPKSPAQ